MKFEHYKRLVAMMFEPDGAGGAKQRYTELDVRQMSPLVLAYVGDAYFHLFVRTRLLSYEQSKVQALHAFSAQIVSAVWQHRAYLGIEPMLTEEERAIYRRGRNAKSHAPRSASVAEYHSSTGFESLLGSLYLANRDERLYEIAEAAGMGVATLYRHFSTKAAIAVAAAQMMWERLMSSYDELVATDAYQRLDGGSRLEVLLATYKERVLYLPGFPAFVDELDRLILAGALEGDVVREYAYVLSCGYSHFQQAYELGRADGSIAREVDFALFYRSLAHALMSVGSKLSRGEVISSDRFANGTKELEYIIDMAVSYLSQGTT